MNIMPEVLQNTENGDSFSRGNDPLVSILLYNYEGRALLGCLDAVFNQQHLRNYEVVLCDDASVDGAWEIANRYVMEYGERITVSRNNVIIGKALNKRKGLKLCKGQYCVELTKTAEFDPVYIARVIDDLETDALIQHSYITRLTRANMFFPPFGPVDIPPWKNGHRPLVSVCIYNFNYGRYLRQCFDSVFAQTYDHIEICFSDNASTDDSWEIALEYADKYPGKISLTRNRVNFGAIVNLFNCRLDVRGKYILKLCSDDALRPTFIERCVHELETHPEAAFAMVHRDIMDENGQFSSEPSFYDQTCFIPGEEQAAVYMMSSVNPSVSQIMYNLEKIEDKRMAGNLNDRWFGDRIMDFHICCSFPIVYIKEPLLLNRVHRQSDSTNLDGNLLQCLAEYVMLHQFADVAASYNIRKAQDRLQPGIEKLGRLCLRYCLRSLAGGDESGAYRYLHLAVAFFPDLSHDETYTALSGYWSASTAEREILLAQLLGKDNLLKRTVSYPPPPGSIPCR